MAEHQGLDIARWPDLSKDFLVNLFAAVGTVAAAVIACVQVRIAQREAERAQRESKEGRIQAAVDRMLQPFLPKTKEENVVKRDIINDIRKRILHWDEHATIIAGRYGCGKTVALEEALRDMQGVYVHRVKDSQWEEQLYAVLGLGDEEMFRKVLENIRRKLEKPPVLVLDIPRSTKEGGGFEAFGAFLFSYVFFAGFQGMDTISSFAKTFSSEGLLAHAGTRRLSRCVLLGCGRVFASCPAEVIVCASSTAMALTFDAGGPQRQVNYWVDDLTEKEAEKLLTLHGHADKKDEFLAACPLAAFFLLCAFVRRILR